MKKIVKIAPALIALIMLLGITSKAAAPALPALPALPYVPPSKVQIFDLINNILGLTKLNVTDDQKRAQAYEEMMLRYMTQSDIDEIVQRARERRKIEIKAGVRDGLQQYALYQVTTGYDLIDQEAIQGGNTMTTADAQRIVDELAKVNVQQTVAELQQRYTKAKNSIGGNLSVCVWVTREGSDFAIWQGFYKAQYNATWRSTVPYGYTVSGDTYLYQSGSGIKYNNRNGTGGTYNGKYKLESSSFWGTHILHINFGRVSENKKPLVQSSAITTALQNSQDIPITANTEIVNGEVSTTQTISVDIPNVIPIPAETVNQLQGVQEQLGVVPLPITQDVTATITQLQEMQETKYGDTEQYELTLTSFFPFCIPYDLYWILTAFDQPAEAPNFDIAISNPFHDQDEEAYFTYHVDLSVFDGVASLVRKLELIIFIVGLCLISRNLILRG